MRQKLSETAWNEARTAYAAGIGLRELARNMGISEGTVLARAKRKGWTQHVQAAKAKAQPPEAVQSNAISPMQSAAAVMADRAERHVEQIGSIVGKVVQHVGQMQPAEVFEKSDRLDKLDRVARRNFGLDNWPQGSNPLIAITIATPPEQRPQSPVIDLGLV